MVISCLLMDNSSIFLRMLAFFNLLCYNTIMVTFDLELFSKLLFSLRTLIKTSICFFNENFESTYACTPPMNVLCSFVKKNESPRCTETDYNALTHCKCDACPDHHYFCNFGMKEMAFKMENHNETYGYIIVGPFKDTQNQAEVLQNIEKFCKKYAIDKQAMLDAYDSMPSFSQEKFESIKVIIHAMFDYAVNKNIITMKHTLFETVITTHVNAHLSDDLSLDALCRRFYLSPKQLYSIIKKATGLTPKQYIIQQRIKEAKRLIATTDRPIQSIAEAVGIPDYSYFIKVFKSATGNTPTHYRKNQ